MSVFWAATCTEENAKRVFSLLCTAGDGLNELKINAPLSQHWFPLLSFALRENRTLTTVDLSFIGLGNEGAGLVARAVLHNERLERLLLAACSVGDEGMVSIALALEQNTTLRNLVMYMNPIGRDGALAVARAVVRNQGVFTIDLGHNRIKSLPRFFTQVNALITTSQVALVLLRARAAYPHAGSTCAIQRLPVELIRMLIQYVKQDQFPSDMFI